MNKLTICDAKTEHIRDIWELRNEFNTRNMMLNNTSIKWEEHKEWFTRVFRDQNYFIFICNYDNKPIGVSRFNQSKNFHNAYEISIILNIEYRGKGFGTFFLKQSINLLYKKLGKRAQLIAKIKKDNFSSKSLFMKNGFKVNSNFKDYIQYCNF